MRARMVPALLVAGWIAIGVTPGMAQTVVDNTVKVEPAKPKRPERPDRRIHLPSPGWAAPRDRTGGCSAGTPRATGAAIAWVVTWRAAC